MHTCVMKVGMQKPSAKKQLYLCFWFHLVLEHFWKYALTIAWIACKSNSMMLHWSKGDLILGKIPLSLATLNNIDETSL